MNLEALKYPIGKPKIPANIEPAHIQDWIQAIQQFPSLVAKEVTHLTDKELRYKYRPEGWTIQQVVGHCVDSHMNSIIRFKLALTEDTPTIKPYDEAPWAELTDTVNYSIQSSTALLAGIHQRWVFLLEQLDDSQLKRTYLHPEGNELVTLEEGLAIYAWHCNHHLQHIINAKAFKY
ncbi:putative metal-dependent hydrolase [Flavobacteriaceae bacterium]|nr:putative metal-dependent hydrolase [Flavobacteriaceae bacterium]MDB9954802.1 putative metal-dependent hydrolase [Flavobacteriaceae bacterium]MDC1265985.1 putative metal-dependent hydrolase [Flavobacteriaceae bacterium]